MYKYFTRAAKSRQPDQSFFDWYVAHLSGGLTISLHTNQFVVTPECAVEEKQIAVLKFVKERIIQRRNGRQIGKPRVRL